MLYFEDFQIGQSRSAGVHELGEADIIAFARQWDPQPWHVDPIAAARTPMQGLTASSAHTYAIAALLLSRMEPVAGIASLKHEMDLSNPARPGDQLTFTMTCVEKTRLGNQAGSRARHVRWRACQPAWRPRAEGSVADDDQDTTGGRNAAAMKQPMLLMQFRALLGIALCLVGLESPLADDAAAPTLDVPAWLFPINPPASPSAATPAAADGSQLLQVPNSQARSRGPN